MGIYISGVKGLPEQVQENKNKIEEVKEQIEGIDFDAVRQLQGQVAENTQDINNLEASIGVQNQAINRIDDKATALERKTQLMSYNDDLSKTDFRNSIDVADSVYATSIDVVGDGTMVNANGSGLHFQEGANDDTLTIANNDGAVQHFLHFNADGTLDIDGNPVGAKPLYQHDLTLYIDLAPTKVRVSVMVINDSNTSINYNGLVQFLSTNNMVNINTGYSASGFLMLTISSVKHNYIVASVYASSGGTALTFESLDLTNNDRYEYAVPTTINVNDKVIQIA